MPSEILRPNHDIKLFQISKMNALSSQVVKGCSMFGEHPVYYEPSIEGDVFDKSNAFEACSNGFDCCDPILNHYHEDLLAELSDLDQWKSDTFKQDASPGKVNSVECTSEWTGILDTMEWIDKFGPTDIAEINCGSPLEYPSIDTQKHVEDLLEHAASLVDWKAWNCYLNGNGDGEHEDYCKEVQDEGSIPLTEDTVKSNGENECNDCVNSDIHGCEIVDLDTTTEDVRLSESKVTIIPKSGPLTWLPSMEDVYTCDSMSTCEKRGVSRISCRIPKRRGVKMKPLGDEETNHRRLLNRKAAFRYRERKRLEQSERKRELECLIHQNNLLKQRLGLVRMEISNWKEKVDQVRNVKH